MVFEESKLLPDWKQAEVHGRASKVGTYDEGSGDVCHCCQEKVHKEEIPLCENTKELDFLGFGFPLYFIFNKYNIVLLLLQIVSYSVLSLYWAYQTSHDLCDLGKQRHLPGGHHGVCTSWLIRFIRTEDEVTEG